MTGLVNQFPLIACLKNKNTGPEAEVIPPFFLFSLLKTQGKA